MWPTRPHDCRRRPLRASWPGIPMPARLRIHRTSLSTCAADRVRFRRESPATAMEIDGTFAAQSKPATPAIRQACARGLVIHARRAGRRFCGIDDRSPKTGSSFTHRPRSALSARVAAPVSYRFSNRPIAASVARSQDIRQALVTPYCQSSGSGRFIRPMPR